MHGANILYLIDQFSNFFNIALLTCFYRELETNVNQPQPSIPVPLGHSLYLNADASNESVALYNSLVTGYKWWDKAHDYAGGAASLLSQNSLNRSFGKVTKTRRRPTNTTHTAPPQ